MSELVVAGFNDGHTALLARAALARLRKDFSLPRYDTAVVTQGEAGKVSVEQSIELDDNGAGQAAFWQLLVRLLLTEAPPTGSGSDAPAERLSAIGIDTPFRGSVAQCFGPGSAALLVLVEGAVIRERVLGVLRGFRGDIVRTSLAPGDRETWRRALSGALTGDKK